MNPYRNATLRRSRLRNSFTPTTSVCTADHEPDVTALVDSSDCATSGSGGSHEYTSLSRKRKNPLRAGFSSLRKSAKNLFKDKGKEFEEVQNASDTRERRHASEIFRVPDEEVAARFEQSLRQTGTLDLPGEHQAKFFESSLVTPAPEHISPAREQAPIEFSDTISEAPVIPSREHTSPTTGHSPTEFSDAPDFPGIPGPGHTSLITRYAPINLGPPPLVSLESEKTSTIAEDKPIGFGDTSQSVVVPSPGQISSTMGDTPMEVGDNLSGAVLIHEIPPLVVSTPDAVSPASRPPTPPPKTDHEHFHLEAALKDIASQAVALPARTPRSPYLDGAILYLKCIVCALASVGICAVALPSACFALVGFSPYAQATSAPEETENQDSEAQSHTREVEETHINRNNHNH